MAGGTVRVEGLHELLGALGRVDRGATREIRKELRVGVGGAFVRDVKDRISLMGLVKSGKLRASIRPAVRGSTLVVRSSPPLHPGRRSSEGYAAVYEYGAHGGRRRRAFLEPTLDAWQTNGKLEESMSGFLGWIESEWRAG